ncbi:HAD family hydrolase [Fusibacter ferrireducens]|uniref:HAD family hydrolase n=1 Tax=Fusibacter ferrireducens TaxID=2785058 RepID=A0ABR9ZTK7_9FIRM|nr:HAD family hydrolase [Fusibacter ferrireducens]MBF4693819.1 HAD family hydrolase [Fusibacter ferrireducens]
MIKGILFDKDGTLIEFEKTWHGILKIVFERLKELGYASDLGAFKKHAGYRAEGFEKESAIQYLATTEIATIWSQLSNKEESIAFLEIMEVFEQVTLDDHVDVELLTGTVETLKYLSEKVYLLGIATSDTLSSCLKSLEKVSILNYFDFIGADDGIMTPKPHIEIGEVFCGQFGLKPEEVLVVGDSITDYEFSRSFGGHFVGIRSTHSKLESSVPADVKLCDHISEIIEIFKL